MPSSIGAVLRALVRPVRAPLVFDRMISLGGVCEVAYQLRRFSRSDRAYPFDWWIMPLRGLPALLRSGADAAFEAAHLQKVPEYDGRPALYSDFAGTVHLHEFRHGDSQFEQSLDAISAVLTEKYAALQRRLAADCASGRTLFVRRFLAGHDPDDPAELMVLLDGFAEQLSGIATDHILLLVGYPDLPARAGILQAPAPRWKGRRGLGSDPGWTLMLRSLGIGRAGTAQARHADLFATFEPAGRPRSLLRKIVGGGRH